MGRKSRFEYPGGIYHLIQRGNNREFIFEQKEDKEYLLELIKEYRETMGFKLYGYVIMGNHYHLIIRISETPLKDIMHRINNIFSRHYNRKNKRTGHVFENRYKGILVIDDRYLLSLLRYVHQNPVSANICKNIKDYHWSKYLKVARTFADMDGSDKIRKKDVASALMSRDLEKDRIIMTVL